MGNMSGTYGSHYTLWQSITENSNNSANNTSNITVKMYLSFDGSSYYAYTNYTTNGSMIINGTSHNYSINPITFSSGQKKDVLLASWTGDIQHDSNGGKTLNVSGSWNTDTSRIGSGNCSATKELTKLLKYPIFTSNPNITKRTVNTLTFSYGVIDISSDLYYSIDNTNWVHITAQYTTISGLNPNTKYTIYIQARNASNNNLKTTVTCSGITYDIAKISTLNNFEHGSNESVTITNPASISNLILVMKIGETQILSRTVSAGNNTISFSDTELDNMYKKYGNGSSLTATFIVYGSGYTNSKNCTITLKGNQKTIKNNVSNSWKRGKTWINVKGVWKRAVVWTNVNGTWRRCI